MPTWQLKFWHIDGNPRLSRTLPSDETVASIGFQLSLGDRRGMLRLGLPYRAIERLGLDRRETRHCDSTDADAAAPPPIRQHPDATVDIVVTAATTPITAAELADLRVGDVLVTETSPDTPLEVLIDGTPEFRAAAGVHRGRKAIRITSR